MVESKQSATATFIRLVLSWVVDRTLYAQGLLTQKLLQVHDGAIGADVVRRLGGLGPSVFFEHLFIIGADRRLGCLQFLNIRHFLLRLRCLSRKQQQQRRELDDEAELIEGCDVRGEEGILSSMSSEGFLAGLVR
ncbi:hypothetical protein F5X99DRAFT_336650 [Biscogniauxia marginata]|nr:hypothetical protein F5X99DRAFT_336650 [Biscogniauxia marginata]